MMRFLLLTLVLTPAIARGSEPRRPLVPELCAADQHPAVTSLAVPAPVRASARRAGRAVRRRPRTRTTDWWLLAAAAAAASVVVISASR